MRSEQEMQFADPDWKPTGPLSVQKDNSVVNVPTPISVSGTPIDGEYDALQPDPLPSYDQGYRGSWQEQPFSTQQPPIQSSLFTEQTPYYSPGVQRAHSRSRWWIWLILAIILFSLISAMFRSASYSRSGPDFHPPFYRHERPVQNVQTFDLNGATQINVNDSSGSILVQMSDANTSNVLVNTDDGSQPQVSYQGSAMTITSSDTGNVTVLVPQGESLNLNVGDNAIAVNGFVGQLRAQTNGGEITLNNDTLSQGSALLTNTGNIQLLQSSLSNATVTSTTGAIALYGVDLSGKMNVQTGGQGTIDFNGTLNPQGRYQFTTESGNIHLVLPSTQGSVAQWQIAQKSGTYSTDFPKNASTSSQFFVGVTTNSGNIAVNQQ